MQQLECIIFMDVIYTGTQPRKGVDFSSSLYFFLQLGVGGATMKLNCYFEVHSMSVDGPKKGLAAHMAARLIDSAGLDEVLGPSQPPQRAGPPSYPH